MFARISCMHFSVALMITSSQSWFLTMLFQLIYIFKHLYPATPPKHKVSTYVGIQWYNPGKKSFTDLKFIILFSFSLFSFGRSAHEDGSQPKRFLKESKQFSLWFFFSNSLPLVPNSSWLLERQISHHLDATQLLPLQTKIISNSSSQNTNQPLVSMWVMYFEQQMFGSAYIYLNWFYSFLFHLKDYFFPNEGLCEFI